MIQSSVLLELKLSSDYNLGKTEAKNGGYQNNSFLEPEKVHFWADFFALFLITSFTDVTEAGKKETWTAIVRC